MVFLVISFVSIFLLVGCLSKSITITGTVVGEDDLPIPKATVSIDNTTKQTNSAGEFFFRLSNNTSLFDLEISADGFVTRKHRIRVDENQTHYNYRITLRKPSPTKISLSKISEYYWWNDTLYGKTKHLFIYCYVNNSGTEQGKVTISLYGYKTTNGVIDNEEKILDSNSFTIPGEAKDFRCTLDLVCERQGLYGQDIYRYSWTKLVCTYENGTTDVIWPSNK